MYTNLLYTELFVLNASQDSESCHRIWTFFLQGMDYNYPFTIRIWPQHHLSTVRFELAYEAHCSSYLGELSRSVSLHVHEKLTLEKS